LANGVARDGRFPEPSPRVSPACHLERCVVGVVDRFTPEQRIVDGVGIGLNEAREATKHVADGSTGVGLSVEDLVLGSRNDDAHWAWLLTAELVAFLPANALGLTLQLGVGKLDALLGHVSGCEVASS